MKQVSNLIGQRFGKLTDAEDPGTQESGKFHLMCCVCECGGQFEASHAFKNWME